MKTVTCECADSGCPCKGKCINTAVEWLYRIDMGSDVRGTAFCAECADDAFGSGLFTTESLMTEEDSAS